MWQIPYAMVLKQSRERRYGQDNKRSSLSQQNPNSTLTISSHAIKDPKEEMPIFSSRRVLTQTFGLLFFSLSSNEDPCLFLIIIP